MNVFVLIVVFVLNDLEWFYNVIYDVLMWVFVCFGIV